MLPEDGAEGKAGAAQKGARPVWRGVPRRGAMLALPAIGGIFLFRGYARLAHWIARITLTLVSAGVAASAIFMHAARAINSL